jgi:hypothetical protein
VVGWVGWWMFQYNTVVKGGSAKSVCVCACVCVCVFNTNFVHTNIYCLSCLFAWVHGAPAQHPFLVCSNLPAQQLPGARCEGPCTSLTGAMVHQRMAALSLLGTSKNSGAPLSPPGNSHNHRDISTAVITDRYSNRDFGDFCGRGCERVLSMSARDGNFSPKVSATGRLLRKLNVKLLRRANHIGPWPQTVFS